MVSLPLMLLLLFSAPEGTPAGMADLSAKIEAVLEVPEPTMIAELEQMVAQFEARPQEVIADTALADELLRGRVVLAWAQQDPGRAAAAMDEAIRSAAGRELPLKGLGTELKTLAKLRAEALEGAGTAVIDVDCVVPCQVIVNERRSVNPTDPLPLGTYRVWVVANKGDVEPMHEDVVLDAAGETKRIEFGQVEEVVPAPAVVEPPKQEKRKRADRKEPVEKMDTAGRKQLLPLWVEIVGIVAGAGLIGTGAALLAIDGRCKGGGDPATCPTWIENTAQGAALVAVGAGAMLSFGVVLGVDRTRAGQGRGAMLSWTFRF